MTNNKPIEERKGSISPTIHPPMEILKSYHVRLDWNIFKLVRNQMSTSISSKADIEVELSPGEAVEILVGVLSAYDMGWGVN
jgi:hypothetical protein